jgi:hypothetical protein
MSDWAGSGRCEWHYSELGGQVDASLWRGDASGSNMPRRERLWRAAPASAMPQLRIASRIFCTRAGTPSSERAARRSASGGEYFRTVSRSISCQIGRIAFSPVAVSRATKPSSSRCGHCLLRNLALMMTTPYWHFASPSSIFRRRLSPSVRTASSNQTAKPAATNAVYNGRAMACLSSEACERKRSYLSFRAVDVAAAALAADGC